MTWQPGWPIRSKADLEAASAVLAADAAPVPSIAKRRRAQRKKITPARKPVPLPGHPGVMVELRETVAPDYIGANKDPRLLFETVVVSDGLTAARRGAVRMLRRYAPHTPDADTPIKGDVLPEPGATRRGVPADYAGDDPRLCNARTKTGRPCRAIALAHGRCKWHGGLSTGPKTPEGKAKVTLNLRRK